MLDAIFMKLIDPLIKDAILVTHNHALCSLPLHGGGSRPELARTVGVEVELGGHTS